MTGRDKAYLKSSNFFHLLFFGSHFSRQFPAFNRNTASESIFTRIVCHFPCLLPASSYSTLLTDIIYLVFFSLVSFSCLPLILCGMGLTVHWCSYRTSASYFPEATFRAYWEVTRNICTQQGSLFHKIAWK